MDDSLVRMIENLCIRPGMYVVGDGTLAEILAFLRGFSFGRPRGDQEDPLDEFGGFVNERFGQPWNIAWPWTALEQFKHLSPEEGRAAFLSLFREFMADPAGTS